MLQTCPYIPSKVVCNKTYRLYTRDMLRHCVVGCYQAGRYPSEQSTEA